MGIEPTSSAWKAEVLPLNYTRPSSFVYRQPPVQPKVRIRPTPVRFPPATWWRGEDSNLRRLSQQIYSLPPLTAREPLRESSNGQFSLVSHRPRIVKIFRPANFPGHLLANFPRTTGARRGIRTPDLLILTHYCFRSRRGSAFGVWTFSSPCRDH